MNPLLDVSTQSDHNISSLQTASQPSGNVIDVTNSTIPSTQTTQLNSRASHPIELNNIQVIFPISSKDPLNQYRKMYDLSKALHLNDRTGLR